MIDYKFVGFLLQQDELEPPIIGNLYTEKNLEISIPTSIYDTFKEFDDYKIMRQKSLIYKHQKYRIE